MFDKISDKIKDFEISDETEGLGDNKSFTNNQSFSDNKFHGSLKFVIRKKKVIFGFLILCLIIGGVFYFKNKKIVGSPDDYVTIEENGARYVENQKAGLKARIPDNWIEKKMDIMEGSMVFYTQDIESVYPNKKDRPPLKKGCMIEVAVGYDMDMNFNDLQQQINEDHEWFGIKSDKFKKIEINNKQVLKNTFDCIEIGYSIIVYFIEKDKLYMASITSGPENIEQ
ncbi:MAG: hypothetical protein U9Q27_00005 [Patescibacteria group bacterium]|nr:hypothetical protein [Patescibacteria group bacterium]